jgi:hypothetical protein
MDASWDQRLILAANILFQGDASRGPSIVRPALYVCTTVSKEVWVFVSIPYGEEVWARQESGATRPFTRHGANVLGEERSARYSRIIVFGVEGWWSASIIVSR